MVPEVAGRGPVCTYPGIKGTTTRMGLLTGASANATGTITVNAVPAILGPTTIHLGEYVLTSDVDFVVDPASGSNTATTLAAAINNLPGYSAPVPGAAVVTVSGPTGPIGNEVVFTAGGVSPYLFVFSPLDSMGSAQPVIGPPTIT